ncbi:DNA-binding protein [bacterium D16-51]|nr:DNA-binding protein [bacterium D16-59]RKI54433.1 DNA-binding protein [bacterium D16-51]
MEDKGRGKTVYTVSEIRIILGIGRNSAYKLCDGKSFPVRKVGKAILIPIKTFNQ